MGDIKEDLRKIPHWVWVGVAGAVTLLYFLNRGSSNAAATTATDPLASVSSGTPSGGVTTGTTTDPMSQFLAELAALQAMNNPTPGPAPTQNPVTTPSGYTPGLPSQAYHPIPISGLNPTTSAPTQSGIDTAYQAVQDQLGVYGGAPVSTSNPYAGQGLGAAWDAVTQTQYAGGGTVTNLGIAQPDPHGGQIVPPAVQTQAGSPVYTYSYGFKTGQTQSSTPNTIASVLQQEIAAGVITQAQASQSYNNTPGSLTGGGANPFG